MLADVGLKSSYSSHDIDGSTVQLTLLERKRKDLQLPKHFKIYYCREEYGPITHSIWLQSFIY